MIEVDGLRATIRDLGSRNGLRVNERAALSTYVLAPGDVIGIGRFALEVRSAGGPQLTTVHDGPACDREKAAAVLYELAERAIAAGWPEEAERLLCIQLASTLESAEPGGADVDSRTERAAMWAATLAIATRNARWFDLALTTYTRLGRAMPEPVARELALASERIADVDASGIVRYAHLLERADLEAEDDRRVLRIMRTLVERLTGRSREGEARPAYLGAVGARPSQPPVRHRPGSLVG